MVFSCTTNLQAVKDIVYSLAMALHFIFFSHISFKCFCRKALHNYFHRNYQFFVCSCWNTTWGTHCPKHILLLQDLRIKVQEDGYEEHSWWNQTYTAQNSQTSLRSRQQTFLPPRLTAGLLFSTICLSLKQYWVFWSILTHTLLGEGINWLLNININNYSFNLSKVLSICL